MQLQYSEDHTEYRSNQGLGQPTGHKTRHQRPAGETSVYAAPHKPAGKGDQQTPERPRLNLIARLPLRTETAKDPEGPADE